MIRRLIQAALLTVISLSGQRLAVGDDSELISREFQLKTAYLYHFGELAEWPDLIDISICLHGSSNLRQFLPVLEGRKIANHAVHVKLLGDNKPENCQILFLSSSATLTASVIEQARAEHILLVGDDAGFAGNGGMVQFTQLDNKLKLLVNLSSVKAAGLKLSSKLLRMAEILE